MIQSCTARCLVLLLSLALSACFELRGQKSHYPLRNVGEATDFKVLTFNILCTSDLHSLTEGYPTWWHRRSAVFRLIDSQDPDLAAIQEASPTQFEEFRDRMSDHYTFVHKAALTTDAFVMFKKDRFDLLEKGFWGLESPLDLKIRRIAVWVKLRDKVSGRELMFVSTHVDAKKIKRREILHIKNELRKEESSGAPLILAGDFNATSETEYYPLLVEREWKDSYIGDLATETKTFPLKNPTRRIDHVFFFGKDVQSTSWQALEDPHVLISDHRAVVVNLHVAKAGGI